ncbi:MAG: DUF3576 domain-containing protein [Alphaproteobacteria bacterium]|nr:DUF3576 domain-containing protein [Alphaproteobacteria bacterium]
MLLFRASFLKSLSFLALPLALSLLAGCADSAIKTDPSYPDRAKEDRYKYGSMVSDEGGFSFFNKEDKKDSGGGGLGVNAYLWRASLDTVSFMPIASADPFGGVIITDWYSAPEAPEERAKVNIFILDRDLRADGVRVSIFRQIHTPQGSWKDAPVAAESATRLEESILTRARQMRLAQKEGK